MIGFDPDVVLTVIIVLGFAVVIPVGAIGLLIWEVVEACKGPRP